MLILGLLLLGAAVVGLLAHAIPPGPAVTLGVAAFAPYLMAAAPVAAVVLLAGRHWILGGIELAATVAAALTQQRLFRRAHPPSDDADVLVVLTSNLLIGRADPHDLVRAVREHRVDVLMLQELTPELQAALLAAGLEDELPHAVSDPREWAWGTGLWSRHPLASTVRRDDFVCAFVTAELTLPDRTVNVAALHLAGPWPRASEWHRDIAHLPAVLDELAKTHPAVVAGDFNATPDIRQYRRLLRRGWVSAAEQAGAGITRSFPSNSTYPPMIAIDHVLTHGGPVATSARTLRLRGTDHRALLVRLALPRRAA